MRALLGFLCLFSIAPAAANPCADNPRTARTEEVRAVLADIAKDEADPAAPATSDLPQGLKEAIEIWTKG